MGAPQPASFLRRAGPLVVARVAGAGLTFFIPLCLVRSLSLTDYGTYKQLFLVAQTLYLIVPFGFGQSLYYFVPRSGAPRAYAVNALAFSGVAGGLAGAALLAGAGPLSALLGNPGLAAHRLALAAYLACLVAASPLEIGLTAQGKTRQAALSYLLWDASRAALMIAPALLGLGLRGIMAAIAGHAAARAAVAWLVLPRSLRGAFGDRRAFAEQARFAAPFGLAIVLEVLQANFHQYVVSHAVPPAAFAIYAVGCFQLPVVEMLYTSTSEVLMVRLSELAGAGDEEEAAAAFRQSVARLAYLLFPMVGFLVAAAPEFIGALFGARFLPAVPLLRIASVAITLAIFPLDGVLRARGEKRHFLVAYAAKAAVTVPLVLAGVRLAGMYGGLASWVLAEALGKVVLFSRVPRALAPAGRRLPLARAVPWRELLRAAGAAGAAGLAVVAARHLGGGLLGHLPAGLPWRLLPLAAVCALFGLGYLASLVAGGVRLQAIVEGLRPTRPER